MRAGEEPGRREILRYPHASPSIERLMVSAAVSSALVTFQLQRPRDANEDRRSSLERAARPAIGREMGRNEVLKILYFAMAILSAAIRGRRASNSRR